MTTTLLLIIHMIICVALVGVVLLQRSEGGALGIGGGGGGAGGFMSKRGTANVLTRTTVFLAAGFFATSIALSIVSEPSQPSSVFDEIEEPEVPVPDDGGLLDFGDDDRGADAIPVPTESAPGDSGPGDSAPREGEDVPATPVPQPTEEPRPQR